MTLGRFLLSATLLTASGLEAQSPVPAKSLGFNVFSRSAGASFYAIARPNRTDCGVTATYFGGVSNDFYFGCFWPTGASNAYVFAGGLRVAGVIGPEVAAWAGDTSGAFIYDTKGTTQHGSAVEQVWYSGDPSQLASWPATARVPGGVAGSIYLPTSQGQIAASNADVWSLAWDGDARLLAGRQHPLGIVVETRFLGWSHPRGAEDILFANYTLYNISATNPAAYANVRAELRPKLLDLAQRYHDDISARLGVTLPADGYAIAQYYVDVVVDADVAGSGSNFTSVNVPLATGFTWANQFPTYSFNTFDPTDHGAPFFSGYGFFGVKLLGAPGGGNALQQFNGTSSRADESDPRDVFSLYRQLTGTADPNLGDGLVCNTGDPLVTHVCRIPVLLGDVRQSVAAAGGSLAPGQSATYSVAYLFAAPYGSCPPGCNVGPGNPLRLSDPALLATGANPVDSLTGFRGFTDLNGDGVVQGGELLAAPRSLLAKAQMAQVLFDAHYLQPSAPAAPDFYLIPGDDRVTVLWRPSATETTGDPYYAIASSPTRVTSDGRIEINPLYDPSFRQFDVEGYRIYRGRTSDPADLILLAQFDYAGTTIKDFNGRINPRITCAPELGLRNNCAANFDSLVPGQPQVTAAEIPVIGQIVQIRDGDRIQLPGGSAAVLRADTTGGSPVCWCDTGVPFSFVDSTARDGFDYFYTVVAFDFNSLQSSPSSLESTRLLKRVRPARPGTNVVSSVAATITFEGRGKVLDSSLPSPNYDLATGRFSGPQPPANLWTADLPNLVGEVFSGVHEARIRLDSLALGQVGLGTGFVNGLGPIPTVFHYTVTADGEESRVAIPVQQTIRNYVSLYGTEHHVPLFPSDSGLTSRYGGTSQPLLLSLRLVLQRADWSGEWALYSSDGAEADGARWFDGPSPERNEVVANPTAGNCFLCSTVSSFNNAGALNGVSIVYQPLSYVMFNREWRNMGVSLSAARRAADYNVYWGSGGLIDSVIDITHNVPVPFSPEAGGTWGVLNTAAQGDGGHDGRPTVLSPTDWSCVEPFRSRLTQPTNGFFPCSSPAPFLLSRTAALGAIAFGAGDNQSTTAPQSVRNPANLSPVPGFALYLAGTISQFGLTALPAKGTVWSLRDYIGFIQQGWSFLAGPRPWTAVGSEIVVRVNARNEVAEASSRDLRRVHTVPDPFYFETGLGEGEGVRFVNLPEHATIRIYSASGILIRLIEHDSRTFAGDTFWDLRTRNGQRVASGVYFYHVESGSARRAGRMTIVNYTN